ncbi:hypothetical protein Trydic_g21550 [Trypoxylus dichotomus]
MCTSEILILRLPSRPDMAKSIFLLIAALLRFTATYPRGYTQLSDAQMKRLDEWTEADKQDIWELSGQFEGDIVLDATRNVVLKQASRWVDGVIPYELAPYFTEFETMWIRKALEQLNETCLTIRERLPEDVDYVYITGEKTGCWSKIGRRGGKQFLNLQRKGPGKGCMKRGTIIHEFLHAAGLYHQQSAALRDFYIEIVWKNIEEGKNHNFRKYDTNTTTSFDMPYDYGSIMHYSAYAFSSNGERTIVPRVANVEIGNRIEMSETDVYKINQMYCDTTSDTVLPFLRSQEASVAV